MTLALGILAEFVAAVLLFAMIAIFSGWRRGKAAERLLRGEEPPKQFARYPDVDLRPGGVTSYGSKMDRAYIELVVAQQEYRLTELYTP